MPAEKPESEMNTPKVAVEQEPKVERIAHPEKTHPPAQEGDVGKKPQKTEDPAPTENKAEEEEPVQQIKKRARTGPLVPDTVIGESRLEVPHQTWCCILYISNC